MPRIIDAMLYAGIGAEPDLLRWRMEELAGLVTDHVVAEGDRTFQGKLRQLAFPPIWNTLPQTGAQVWHHIAVLPEHAAHPMDREIVQRNAISAAVAFAGPDDLILVSDVDEIPKAEAVKHAIWRVPEGSYAAVGFYESLHHGWINMRCLTHPWWAGTRAVRRRWLDVPGNTPQALRVAGNIPIMPDAGYHWSFLGGVEAYQVKLSQWSHFEHNIPPYNTTENIREALEVGRDWETSRNMKYQLVPLDNTYPTWMQQRWHEPEIAQYVHPAFRLEAAR